MLSNLAVRSDEQYKRGNRCIFYRFDVRSSFNHDKKFQNTLDKFLTLKEYLKTNRFEVYKK